MNNEVNEKKTLTSIQDSQNRALIDLKKALLIQGDLIDEYHFKDGIEQVSAQVGPNAFKWNYDHERIITQMEITLDYIIGAISEMEKQP